MFTRLVQESDNVPSGTARSKDRAVVELPPPLAGPAQKTAERWAARVLLQLRVESRRICGGWPGTITEARAVLAGDLLPQLTGESLDALERVGHERVARFLYQGAREYWARREHRRERKHDRAGAEDGA